MNIQRGMAKSSSTECLHQELVRGSEECSLSEAKFKLVGKIVVDCGSPLHIKQLSKVAKGELLIVIEANGMWTARKVLTSSKVLGLPVVYGSGAEVKLAVMSRDELVVYDRNGLGYFYYESGTESYSRQNVDLYPDFKCIGIGYVDGHLICVFNNEKLIFKVIKGKLYGRNTETCVPTGIDLNVYNGKMYVSAVKEKGVGVVYVSGPAIFRFNQITKLSLDGQVLAVYNDWRYYGRDAPLIAASGDGHLFVGFHDCIQIIAPEMDRAVTVLDSKDGISTPVAMCYCSEEKQLYVCNHDSKEIMVFGEN